MSTDPLSRRERQLMDIVYRLEEATAAEVRDEMHDAPSYSTVRTQLGTLAKKGHLAIDTARAKHVYRPTVSRGVASRSALKRVVDAFFGGRASDAAVALLSMEDADLSADQMARLRALVDDAASNRGGKA